MKHPPSCQFYWSDFLTSTAEMPPDAVGCYIRLLGYQWINGSIPADHAAQARLLGLSTDEWGSLKGSLEGRFEAHDGRWANGRMERVRKEQIAYRERQAAYGRAAHKLPTREPSRVASALHLQSSSSSSPSDKPSSLRSDRVRASKRCPADFLVSDELLIWAAGEGISQEVLQRESPKFMDYTFASAKTDWPATWRNWMRKAKDSKLNGASNGKQKSAATILSDSCESVHHLIPTDH